MRIGIITYYKVLNFGANLQAVSTYCYLKGKGHEPVFINYISKEGIADIEKGMDDPQWNAHIDFVNHIIKEQTPVCQTVEEVLNIINDYGIESIIVGSDALLQHHPFITRIRKARRKIIYIQSITSDRLFPNLFWGVGLSNKIPMALMSVSSQNSEYNLFLPSTKKAMFSSLKDMRYISVRDNWTQYMVKTIMKREVPVTPDPVFAFNQNLKDMIPNKEYILNRFKLPDKYVLLSLFSQVLSEQLIKELKQLFQKDGISLVILPLPTGVKFKHNIDFEIKLPLSPIDWYALLKYSNAYIGSNMHPIVSCLHNTVPCFSIDNWGRTNFWGHKKYDGSSKVQHIMEVFGVKQNHRLIENGQCKVTALEIYEGIMSFPKDSVSQIASKQLSRYNNMMEDILTSLKQ